MRAPDEDNKDMTADRAHLRLTAAPPPETRQTYQQEAPTLSRYAKTALLTATVHAAQEAQSVGHQGTVDIGRVNVAIHEAQQAREQLDAAPSALLDLQAAYRQ